MASDLSIWNDKWKEGRTDWHKNEVNKQLKTFHEKMLHGREAQNMQVFVPLCGKCHELKFLYDKGHKVVGVEAVAQPIEEFFQEHAIQYKKVVCDAIEGGADVYQSTDGRLKIFCCDLFKFNEKCCGQMDGVWDRESLVAIDPNLKSKYIALMDELLAPKFRYLIEAVEYKKAAREGGKELSPHPISTAEMRILFQSYKLQKLFTIFYDPAIQKGWKHDLPYFNESCYVIYSKDDKYNLPVVLT